MGVALTEGLGGTLGAPQQSASQKNEPCAPEEMPRLDGEVRCEQAYATDDDFEDPQEDLAQRRSVRGFGHDVQSVRVVGSGRQRVLLGQGEAGLASHTRSSHLRWREGAGQVCCAEQLSTRSAVPALERVELGPTERTAERRC